ncbi:aldolase/citrate lyase family protein, partial [Bacteroidota bacterium]
MSKIRKSAAGKRGTGIRSDCYIELKLKRTGGIKIKLESKVKPMYGESIKRTIMVMSKHLDVKNADILIEDYGALPPTLMARYELAVKRTQPSSDKEYLPSFNKKNKYSTTKERLRRSRLYLPGNEPKFFPNAGLHQPDAIILDLEDSVSPSEKDSAQILVRNVLRTINFYGAERMVRINQLPRGLQDLEYIIPNNVHVILIPKCESKENILAVHDEVTKLKAKFRVKNDIYYMPIIESALGVENAYEIASASEYNCALAVGLEDYTADIGAERTFEGSESFYARTAIVNAAKAAGIQAIDTVFSDVANMEGLRQRGLEAKGLGFEGK